MIMRFLSDRYVKVFSFHGLDICTLKVANPSAGDELGYRIDSPDFEGEVFNHPDDAIIAIVELGW